MLSVLVMSALCLALRPLLVSRLKLTGPSFTSLFQGSTRWQTFIALAVAGSLFGEFGLALASVAAVAMIPILNVISVWVLARYAAPTPPSWQDVLMALVKNPFIGRASSASRSTFCMCRSQRLYTLSPTRLAVLRWRSGFCSSALACRSPP